MVNVFLDSSLSEDQSLVFEHGGDVQTVDRHQVHVRDTLGGDGDVLRELVLRVHKENTGGPTSACGETEEMIGEGRGEF